MNRFKRWISRWHSPLARRLALGVILFSLAVTLVLTALQLYGEYRNDVRSIERDLDQVEQVHLKAMTRSLWATNLNEVRLQLEGLTQIPNFRYAAVFEGDRLWAETGRRDARNTIERRYPMRYWHRDTNSLIGTLTVVASLDGVYEQLVQHAIVILASNAFNTFLVAGFTLTFFYWLVTRHLLGITEYLRQLRPGVTQYPLRLGRARSHRLDELDELTGAVNRLQEETREAMSSLRESERRIHAIADYTYNWENWVGTDGRLVWVNASVERITGYTPAECLAMEDFPLPLVAPGDRERATVEFAGAVQGGRGGGFEFRLRRKDGSVVWASAAWQPIYGVNGEPLGHRSSVQDISERKRAELLLAEKLAALERAEDSLRQLLTLSQQERARLDLLLSAMTIGVLFEDKDKRVLYHNPAFRRMWLIPEELDIKGMDTREALRYSGNALARPDHFSRHILQVLSTHEVSEVFEIVMADGRVVTQLSYPVRDPEDRFLGRLWIFEDVTRERQTAEQLIYLAERDSLSGLYNRHRFQEELGRMVAEAGRRNSQGALLFFDLDEFKYVNDTFGHRAGDSMLIRVAGEVSGLIRRNEIFARLGGDEFAVLMPDVTIQDAERLAERIIRAIAQIPFRFDGQNLRLTTSLGIAIYPLHGGNAEDLVTHADTAMYQAKEAGKNAWRLYRADLDASRELLGRLNWQERIANALDKNLFVLHFQGVYRASDQQLSHLEALVRMVDEGTSGQLIMPGHFIDVAEKTGKIADIDRWVIREAVRRLAGSDRVPPIAVNISGRTFDDPRMPQFIAETLKAEGVAPHRLIVELTETAAVSDLHDAQRFIEALHNNGTSVCLDDFGTGFASFAYLKHLRAQTLKIDGLFVRDLPNEFDNQVFVKSIVDVARGLRKVTVAEFVEDAETLEMLRRFGVDFVQGYHLDTPRADHPALGPDGA